MRVRFVPTVIAAVVLAGSLAFAVGLPGEWKVLDGGKVVRKIPPGGVTHAFVTNDGPDRVTVSSKGKVTVTYTINPGTGPLGFQLPAEAKNVKIVDANSGNGLAAKGILLWGKKGPQTDKKGGISHL